MAKKQRKFAWFSEYAETYLSDDRHMALPPAASNVAQVLRCYAWAKTDIPGVFIRRGHVMSAGDLIEVFRRYRPVRSRRSNVREWLQHVVNEALILNTKKHPLKHLPEGVYYMPDVLEAFRDSEDRAKRAKPSGVRNDDQSDDHIHDHYGDQPADQGTPHNTVRNSTGPDGTYSTGRDGTDKTNKTEPKKEKKANDGSSLGLEGPAAPGAASETSVAIPTTDRDAHDALFKKIARTTTETPIEDLRSLMTIITHAKIDEVISTDEQKHLIEPVRVLMAKHEETEP
jgi:hypothetical protein